MISPGLILALSIPPGTLHWPYPQAGPSSLWCGGAKSHHCFHHSNISAAPGKGEGMHRKRLHFPCLTTLWKEEHHFP